MTWREEVACRGMTDLFYPSDRRTARFWSAADERHQQVCLAVCRGCPVRRECREWVLGEPEDPCPEAVVAGMAPEERDRARRRGTLAT